ncbi:hypothetical protein [Chitinophaga polysaccharea]|uniref:hypothetical protein n=1 Tax=Chitinophaga polysaccharea TaxID=1293035 RepID=UPI00115ACCBA|nr:hypothetical protein [Chitinophaga polysaccharea]
MWIDFAAHGDKGLASYRAQQATKGEVLGVAMKESSRPLFPRADKYWLVDLRNYFKTERHGCPENTLPQPIGKADLPKISHPHCAEWSGRGNLPEPG